MAPQKSCFGVVTMSVLREEQITLLDAVIPETVKALPEELAKIDTILLSPTSLIKLS
jgi:hypothetical protein